MLSQVYIISEGIYEISEGVQFYLCTGRYYYPFTTLFGLVYLDYSRQRVPGAFRTEARSEIGPGRNISVFFDL